MEKLSSAEERVNFVTNALKNVTFYLSTNINRQVSIYI